MVVVVDRGRNGRKGRGKGLCVEVVTVVAVAPRQGARTTRLTLLLKQEGSKTIRDPKTPLKKKKLTIYSEPCLLAAVEVQQQ